MGKKKLSLKRGFRLRAIVSPMGGSTFGTDMAAVNRGFATTSVASKKQLEAAKEESAAKQDEPEANVAAPISIGTGGNGAASSGQATAKEDWEDEGLAEQNALQALVDRLHEKGEKEVSRIVKGIEYDKRMAAGLPQLRINEAVRDQVLGLALRDEGVCDSPPADPKIKAITSSPSAGDTDKILLRLFVTFNVLSKLGFSEARVRQCILSGLGDGGNWVDAIDWMWLHLSEDECLQRGEFARKEELLIEELDEPLLPHCEGPPDPPAGALSTPGTGTPTPARSATPALTEPTSLFQSMDGSDDSDATSEPEVDVGMQQANEEWAKLQLQLDDLKIAAGGGAKGRSKKVKGNGVVIETPEMRKLKEKIGLVEKEYMFSRKQAGKPKVYVTAETEDVLFRSVKARRDADALQARLSGRSSPPKADLDAEAAAERSSGPNKKNSELPIDDEDEGGLFGNMLDEPPSTLPATATQTGENSSILVRSMPITPQTYAGTTPKALLRTHLGKSYKSASIQYIPLSGHSRAARSGLQIALTPTRRKVWRMDDIACEDMIQAENYVATLALHTFSSSGKVQSVNPNVFPLAFRDLWDELERERRQKDDESRRNSWRVIRELYDQKASSEEAKQAEMGQSRAEVEKERNGPAHPKRPEYLEHLQRDYLRRQSSQSYQAMLPQRDSLPIAAFRQEILDTLARAQVMVLSGETGCGKSTQLPAYILEDQLSQGKPCKIFVTEPRRISAISLAQRVSAELGDLPGQMGSSSSLVGYSIRLEAKVSPSTRLAFVTNGIALRMLESGSAPGKSTAFDEVTHIIVDEVHERSIDSDFLLIVLRQLLAVRPDLKVVLMSATLDADKISGYFGGCPVLSVPGRTFPVEVNYLEDAVELAQWRIDETSPYAIRARNARSGKQLEWNEDAPDDSDEEESDPSKLSSSRYSAETASTVNILDSRQIPYDLILRLLERICFDEQYSDYSAAVLVFMPGLAEIRKLNDMLSAHPDFGGRWFKIYPLHSTISSEGQSAVFDLPPVGVRKIVISTNIAETGVTIPDITCVIDSGKHREMRYDEKRQISRLVETYIARSNAKQRRGRAGRVREGLAFHLFTRSRHDTQLAEHPIPEMLRLSLQDLALRIKILRLKLGNSIEEVLLKALDPPTSLNVQRAIASLVEVKALTVSEEITPMGRLLSKLPMDVHLGKFLLVAALMRCLDPALTIAATLNSKSPWITPFGQEQQARTVRQGFAVDNSDFLTLVNVFDSWRRVSDNPHFVPVFCRKNFVSQQNLQQIEELRQQLLSYLVDSGFVTVTPEQKNEISQARYSRAFKTRFVTVPPHFNDNGDNHHILNAALAAGLYPKILSIDASGSLKTITNQQPVSIHPGSVNFKLRPGDFGTAHLAYFTIMQSKRLYAWELGPVDDRALVLLCGDQADVRASAGSIQLDRKIRYAVSPKTGIAIKHLREQLAGIMAIRMRGKALSPEQEEWFELGMKCLCVGVYDGQEESVGINLAAK